ncbi:DUF4328 domain-containing protein [Streptomyces sp. NPDC049970]|uniref:DUF4328 domain-containing protein n=1 Tax=Streptomyces sp. NPDC049970 TaxID=3155033 RepID=UPI0034307259
MLCTDCGARPAASADGRCPVCAANRPAHPNGPTGLRDLRSPVGLGRAAVVLLAVVIATDVVALAAGLNVRGEFAALGGAATYDADPVTRAEAVYGIAGGLQGLVTPATGVVFIIWFHRLRLNAEVFDAGLQPMRPGWAIGAWFVPVANIWLPRRVAGGIWEASAQHYGDGGRRTVSKAPLNLWWAVYIGSAAFSWVVSKNYERAVLPGELTDAVTLVMSADALDIVAAVLAIVFVRELTRMQCERAALGPHPLSAAPSAGPVPD